MRYLHLALLFLLPLSTLAGTEWIQLESANTQVPIKNLVHTDFESSIIELTVPGYDLGTQVIDGKEFATVTLPEYNNLNLKGYPSLPKIATSLAIPGTAKMELRVLEEECSIEKIGEISPAKGTVYRNQNPELVPFTFSKFYNSADVYPRSNVELGTPFIIRGVRGVTIYFYPFQYLAKTREVRICNRVKVELFDNGFDEFNVITIDKTPAIIQADYKEIYSNLFLNHAILEAKHDVVEKDKLLIIAHDKFVKEIQPLLEWKLQRGLEAKVVKTSELAKTPNSQPTPDEIKAFIQSEYKLRGISHILLVGDAEEVPPAVGTAGNVVGKEADPMYVLLDGNDSYPDAFISRFSGSTPGEIITQVERSIAYEKTPEVADWYNKAVGIAGDDKGGNPSYADWERAEMLRVELLKYPYAMVDQFYHHPATADVLKSLNDGRGYINYINHGSTTSWPVSGISTSTKFENTRLPFIVSVACVNGKFKGGTCLAESFLRAGAQGKPTGAIAMYASSTNQSWVPPCIGQRRVTDLLVARKKLSIGGLFMNGVIATLEDNDSSAIQTYQSWHVFGDGSIISRTEKPVPFTVKHPDALSKSEAKLSLSVEKTQGALVSLYSKGITFGSGYTDKDGNATISTADCGCIPEEELTLTVTGFNRVPYITTIKVKE